MLPGGTLLDRDGNTVAMLVSDNGLMNPVDRDPARLYRPHLNGDTIDFGGPVNTSMPPQVTQISGFQDSDGTWNFVTNSIDRNSGITMWRVKPGPGGQSTLGDTRTWEFYDYQKHQWIHYTPGAKLPIMPSTIAGTGELDYRRLADGSTALMWGGDSINKTAGGFNLAQFPPMEAGAAQRDFNNAFTAVWDFIEDALNAAPLAADLRIHLLKYLSDARVMSASLADGAGGAIRDGLDSARARAAAPDLFSFSPQLIELLSQRVDIPGSTHQYAPIMVDPQHSSFADIRFQYSQWLGDSITSPAERYGIFPAHIGGYISFPGPDGKPVSLLGGA